MLFTPFVVIGFLTLFAMASAGKDLDRLLASSERFATSFFSAVRQTNRKGNVVASPASLQPVLAMLLMGAEGNTKNQLAKALHMVDDGNSDWPKAYGELQEYLKDPVFSSASSLFIMENLALTNSYKTGVSSMGAALEQVNFKDSSVAASTINGWCDKNTKGKIQKIFEPSDLENTVMVVANALHFKANWKHQFNRERTHMADFHSPSGTIKVPMMFVKGMFKYSNHNEIKAELLLLPYQSDKFSMLVILPHKDSNLDEVQSKLAKVDLKEAISTMWSQEVEVRLPKFKIESDLDLKGSLALMGITDMFDAGTANLSRITESATPPLFVGQAKQKVVIEVNEEGTEAAAVSAARIQKRSLNFNVQFEADRPFNFVILSKEAPILYGGVWQPEANEIRHIEL